METKGLDWHLWHMDAAHILGRRRNWSTKAVMGAVVHAGAHARNHIEAADRHASGIQIWSSVSAGFTATTSTGVATVLSGTGIHGARTMGIGVPLALPRAFVKAIIIELERGVALSMLGHGLGLAPLVANRVAVIPAIWRWWCRCWLLLLRHRRMEQYKAHHNDQGSLESGSSRSHRTCDLPSFW
jgi:hypothetical protein